MRRLRIGRTERGASCRENSRGKLPRGRRRRRGSFSRCYPHVDLSRSIGSSLIGEMWRCIEDITLERYFWKRVRGTFWSKAKLITRVLGSDYGYIATSSRVLHVIYGGQTPKTKPPILLRKSDTIPTHRMIVIIGSTMTPNKVPLNLFLLQANTPWNPSNLHWIHGDRPQDELSKRNAACSS